MPSVADGLVNALLYCKGLPLNVDRLVVRELTNDDPAANGTLAENYPVAISHRRLLERRRRLGFRLAQLSSAQLSEALLQRALHMFAAVEPKKRGLLFDDRVDLHRTAPTPHESLEHLAGPIEAKVDALVVVLQQQLTAVAVV